MRPFSLIAILSLLTFPITSFASWHAIMVSGDDAINNFDHGRQVLGRLLQQRGLNSQQHLDSQLSNAPHQNQTAHLFGLAKSFNHIPADAQGCLFYLSSHGQKNQGVYLKRASEQTLTPKQLNVALNKRCGDKPTVVLISACYSGQFIPVLKSPNRIVLTAAAASRPSFGCSEDTEYTFWDGCIIAHLPKSDTWQQLSEQVNSCISRKEQALGYPASLPQAFFGDKVQDLAIQF